MKSILLVASLLVMLSLGTANAADAIILDDVFPFVDEGKIKVGETVRFTFRWTYDDRLDSTFVGFTNGFVVYEKNDGNFYPITCDTLASATLGTYFDGGVLFNDFSVNGTGKDTIGIGGFCLWADGITTDYDQQVYWIETGSDNIGDTICIDSAWYPPGGVWLWSMDPFRPESLWVHPDWAGPYCFAVVDPSGVTLDDEDVWPDKFSLSQNYPNPFNPRTVIKFDVPVVTHVSLKVFNVLGQEVETLVDKELSPGNYTADWDGSNIASGVYFYKLESETFTETRKMILVK